MLIRATEDACFVMLKNGLTLELFYDRALSGRSAAAMEGWGEENSARPSASAGVWLMGETVVWEIHAGQA